MPKNNVAWPVWLASHALQVLEQTHGSAYLGSSEFATPALTRPADLVATRDAATGALHLHIFPEGGGKFLIEVDRISSAARAGFALNAGVDVVFVDLEGAQRVMGLFGGRRELDALLAAVGIAV